MESPIVISPPNMILFKGPLNNRVESSFTIRNNSMSFICFKIKTSSFNEFKVHPSTSVVRSKEEANIQVIFIGPQESKNKGQKFLIQVSFGSDLSLIDWKSKDLLEFKIGTKFLVPDIDEKLFQTRSSVSEVPEGSFVSKNSTVYFENDDENSVGKKEEKNKKSGKVRNFGGNYSIPHLLLSFVVGLFIGFYILS